MYASDWLRVSQQALRPNLRGITNFVEFAQFFGHIFASGKRVTIRKSPQLIWNCWRPVNSPVSLCIAWKISVVYPETKVVSSRLLAMLRVAVPAITISLQTLTKILPSYTARKPCSAAALLNSVLKMHLKSLESMFLLFGQSKATRNRKTKFSAEVKDAMNERVLVSPKLVSQKNYDKH